MVVRGPWIVKGYMKGDGKSQFGATDDWFQTGDVCKIEADGSVVITDRSKDVIKSGGEWISSIDLENAAMGHPAVAEAAVIGVPHPKWDEAAASDRGARADADVTKDDLLTFLDDKIAKWWLPDDVQFIDAIPHSATGKILKTGASRQAFRGLQAAELPPEPAEPPYLWQGGIVTAHVDLCGVTAVRARLPAMTIERPTHGSRSTGTSSPVNTPRPHVRCRSKKVAAIFVPASDRFGVFVPRPEDRRRPPLVFQPAGRFRGR